MHWSSSALSRRCRRNASPWSPISPWISAIHHQVCGTVHAYSSPHIYRCLCVCLSAPHSQISLALKWWSRVYISLCLQDRSLIYVSVMACRTLTLWYPRCQRTKIKYGFPPTVSDFMFYLVKSVLNYVSPGSKFNMFLSWHSETWHHDILAALEQMPDILLFTAEWDDVLVGKVTAILCICLQDPSLMYVSTSGFRSWTSWHSRCLRTKGKYIFFHYRLDLLSQF